MKELEGLFGGLPCISDDLKKLMSSIAGKLLCIMIAHLNAPLPAVSISAGRTEQIGIGRRR